MARIEAKAISKKKFSTLSIPFTGANYIILATGLLFIVLGYIALGQDPWDGSMPLVVAPILLVAGYCVLIPVGILFRKKAVETQENAAADAQTKA